MAEPDLYKTLGVSRGASPSDIKKVREYAHSLAVFATSFSLRRTIG